jgi:hypothetical protein
MPLPHHQEHREIPAASCPTPSSGGSILSAQTSTLIGAETGIKPLPQCTANVRFGSITAQLFSLRADLCLLLPGGLN